MDTHVLIIEYIGDEPGPEAIRGAVEGISKSGVRMADQTINPVVLDERDKTKALYLLGLLKGAESKSTLSIEVKGKKRSKKSIIEAIAKALEDVEDV